MHFYNGCIVQEKEDAYTSQLRIHHLYLEMHNENVLMDIQKKENKNDINVDVLLSQLQNDYLNK